MTDKLTLNDFDFSKARHVEGSDPAAGWKMNGTILLRIVEGAPVALHRVDSDSDAELIPARNDIYAYRGGYGWGYKGSGPASLSHAIAALAYPALWDASDIAEKASEILEQVVSRLDRGKELDLPITEIYRRCGEPLPPKP